jgi:hypothetical protein
LSVDGGKVRVRILGEACEWKVTKPCHRSRKVVNFKEGSLIDWVNEQALGKPVVCLGDGHDGIWNFSQIAHGHDERF